MLVIDNQNYENFLSDNGIDESWNERDFVSEVKKYIRSTLNKVLLISGLRGTGKSVGTLQAIKDQDAVYIIMQKGIKTTPLELMRVLKSRRERIIVLDEYTWVDFEGRAELDGFLFTLVQNGKRIIVTGTESLNIEALKAGELIHRAQTIHTNQMTFAEYCRIFNKPMDQHNCDEYLMYGGVFEEYVVSNTQSMSKYIEEAIIGNLYGYARDNKPLYNQDNIPNIVYTLLHRAIWDLTKNNPKLLSRSESIETQEVLDRFGIDLEGKIINQNDLNIVSDMLCQIGVLVKIPNLRNEMEHAEDKDKEFKTYIVNPSLTCQFIKTLFPNFSDMNTILGLVYEANCMVDMYQAVSGYAGIYYIESHNSDNYEIDIVIADNDDTKKKQFYLFECKHRFKVNIYNENWLIVNGKVDDALKAAFPDSEIAGRYIIHPGENDWQTHISGREVAVVNQDERLYHYYDFDKYRPTGHTDGKKSYHHR